MTTVSQLSHLLDFLDGKTSSLENHLAQIHAGSDKYNDEAFLLSLDLGKLSTNMEQARSALLDLETEHKTGPGPKITDQRTRLTSLNGRVQHIEFTIRQIKEHESQLHHEEIKRQKALEAAKFDKGVSSTLKHRRRSSQPAEASSASMSVDSKLSLQKNVQESLTSEILGMVSNIKENAQQLSMRLAEDLDVVSSTGEALNKSASSMGKVGSRLDKYRSTTAISWWFYIYAALFMVVAVVGGMIVVQLFPKW